ncbi:MAG: hypothetical protein H8E66_24790 [Planctomycetes bacterium]|nr:hypothetical protein [Planctomycetota bacterium]
MNSFEATAHVVTQLEDKGVPYMLVGALSSNAYGIPRATKDADIVVSFDSIGVVEFAKSLGSGFELDRQMRMETITNSIRNIITYKPTNFDIELFRLSHDEHHKERFDRRKRRWLDEIKREACLPSAEDVVIQKLRWKRRKDLDDAENILAVRAKQLDWDYLTHWTKIHGTNDLLNQLRDECPNLDSLDEE